MRARKQFGHLKTALEEQSIEVVAHQSIEPTKQWRDVIEAGLRSCDALGAWPASRQALRESSLTAGRGRLGRAIAGATRVPVERNLSCVAALGMGRLNVPAGGASFVSSPLSRLTRTEETGLEIPMTQRRTGPSRASVERARVQASVDRAGAERYKLRQRAIRRGASAGHGRAQLSEFEARGFSIPRLASGFVRHVGRLINGN
jgi:hypothetical protein